jgi:hypothetical protein
MNLDSISEISIDEEEKLRVYPHSTTYDHIYRSATEVRWDTQEKYLYSPKPREWSYLDWYAQIIKAVKSEYGNLLIIDEKTEWKNISEEIRNQIMSWAEKQDSLVTHGHKR